ncbi:hypothetical protein ABVK25_010455 [Lepraria finkii]|uniref:Uncharacterized protein n=1 Tax=Lepraria finkii TaxID=1340010 RepID=A0ABR4AWI3_9LECA
MSPTGNYPKYGNGNSYNGNSHNGNSYNNSSGNSYSGNKSTQQPAVIYGGSKKDKSKSSKESDSQYWQKSGQRAPAQSQSDAQMSYDSRYYR